MNTIDPPLAHISTEPLHRLARDVRAAVADGGWGASEASSLHLWLRADLLPRAMSAAGRLPQPEKVGHILSDLVRADAEIVASVGEDLVNAVYQLEIAVDDLLRALRLAQHDGRHPV